MYEGREVEGSVGECDLYLMLADRYGWTPEEVGRMDPDFVQEVTIRLRAQGDVAAEARTKAEAERRAAERRARIEAREHRALGKQGTDVSIEEIV